jgi:hypothetical protein
VGLGAGEYVERSNDLLGLSVAAGAPACWSACLLERVPVIYSMLYITYWVTITDQVHNPGVEVPLPDLHDKVTVIDFLLMCQPLSYYRGGLIVHPQFLLYHN